MLKKDYFDSVFQVSEIREVTSIRCYYLEWHSLIIKDTDDRYVS